ncbi:MAG: transposase [bacterium]|nr:transposase [bacterium]
MLPESFGTFLLVFESCFTTPSYQRFLTLMTGWVLCTGKHTVTGVMRAAGVVGTREHSGYHRFFNGAAWSPDQVGIALMRLALKAVPKGTRANLTIDDTLGRHTGKHISSAGMHRDPLLSCAGKPFWHFGHNWVVLAVVIEFPRWNKVFSLPVLMRLYRTAKVNKAMKLPHVKRTELAAETLALVFKEFPQWKFLLIGDNAYINNSVVRSRPDNFHIMGRGRMDAALYATAPKQRGKGRPRVKGKRVASPKNRRTQWKTLKLLIYGRPATVQVRVFKAVWYKVSYNKQMLFVVVRNWPGHKKEDVLACTDLDMTAQEVIQLYCQRWSLEETFGWVKSRLGFEDPQNRTERAVQRTAPMAMWTYSLVILWYVNWSKRRTRLPLRLAPWYRTKKAPSFADMLATLRCQSWTLWISDQAGGDRLDQKKLEPLLDAVGYA